ncbi:MAG TPA: D-alanine--D-alanine ligase [Verrucomicrobiales bacterium]|nr:D-alanine--D-alanine ligase [Verrucomicrobiales bacterium]
MKVAVVFGGSSEERDVSIASGLEVISGLRAGGHEVIAVDTAKGVLTSEAERSLAGFNVLEKPPESNALVEAGNRSPVAVLGAPELNDVDVVFIALHGGSGEDGTFQALLEAWKIPFTGAGHIGSAIAMDKDVSKRLMVSVGVPTPAWQMCSRGEERITNALGFPVIVKPNSQGSTIGLTLVRVPEALPSAIANAAQFGHEIMLEAYVGGREFTVGILDGAALAVGEIVAPSEIFDYESKYQRGGAKEVFPADISAAESQEIQELGARVHKVLKLSGYSRVDFRRDDAGKLWCLEANNVPGLTPTSLLPQSAKAVEIEFSELCERICELGIGRSRDEKLDR